MAKNTATTHEIECYTPNGREIRRNLATGKFEVQPERDNYWIACDTLEEAFRAYHPEWDGENHDVI
jgi:hypothetical protein